MIDNDENARNDSRLIRQHLDGLLTEPQFAAFNERLLKDQSFRETYVRLADLEANLYDEFSDVSSTTRPDQKLRSQDGSIPASRRWRFVGGTVCLVLLNIFLYYFTFRLEGFGRQEDVPAVPGEKNGQVVASDSDPQAEVPVRLDALDSAPVVAIVVSATGVSDSELRPGVRFRPGVLKLTEGTVQLEFMGGAVVAVAAPAELRLESKDAATLVTGRVSARVPARARGFVLNAPSAAVVDLGTEFGIRAGSNGTSEVAVIDGEVELSLLGDDGNTLLNRRLVESDAVWVNRDDRSLVAQAPESLSLPPIVPPNHQPLLVGDAYLDAVCESSPIIFWRFETTSDGRIPNSVGPRWPLSIVQPEGVDRTGPEAPVIVEHGHVRFGSHDLQRYLVTEEPIEELNSGPFSIEFWMKPDCLAHATCLGVFPVDSPSAINHLNVVEIVTDSYLIHEPGSVRFLHRNPPAQQVQYGSNVFSPGLCTPGQWQQVVAVKGETTAAIYFNGRLARRVPLEEPNGEGSFKMIIGQLNLRSNWRQFIGLIDEMSVYRRALSAEEITQHYKLISDGVSQE